MLKVASIFSQILGEISLVNFEKLVIKHGAEKHAKGFKCWTQLVAMLFCHLAHADSLREICHGLACCNGKLVHLGIKRLPNKSTLSYANEHRPAELYRELFWSVLDHFQSLYILGCRKKKFRFKNKLLSLDSTTIDLCLNLFQWAEFRQQKGGVKVHVLLDHDSYMPSFVHVTEANVHDINVARILSLPSGSIVAMDKAYIDFKLMNQWNERGIFFVTRMKKNAAYRVVEQRPLPKKRNILNDEIVQMTGHYTSENYPAPLRRIVVWDKENEREIVLLTNHLDFGATTIAAIYKDRWEIELFFKALKQNLKVKTFIGTSRNALLIQIWTALLALAIIKWLHHLSKAGWSFSSMAVMTRLNLFTYRNLKDWLDEPYATPPLLPEPEQLKFVWK